MEGVWGGLGDGDSNSSSSDGGCSGIQLRVFAQAVGVKLELWIFLLSLSPAAPPTGNFIPVGANVEKKGIFVSSSVY